MAWAESIFWLSNISLCLALFVWYICRNGSSKGKAPPGPPGLPLIGSILDMGRQPHEYVFKLRDKYGPVVGLKVGMKNMVVIQSAKAAEELIKKHDPACCDRTVPDSFTACNYDTGSCAMGHYGEYWRMLRKLCSSELFTQKRISSSAHIRRKSIDAMINCIEEDAAVGSGQIELHRYIVLMIFNLLSNTLFSKDISDIKSESRSKFYEALNEFTNWNGKPNIVDTIPLLKWLDPQGIRKNSTKHLTMVLEITSQFVKERIQERLSGKEKATKDFLDTLLDYQAESKGSTTYMTDEKLAIIIVEMFFAGTDTTSGTVHWGMAELIHNPNSLRKLKDEINQVVGPSREVEEDDLSKLPYLQAVVKETMRLHPSLPMLIPRNVMNDFEFMGYFIPKNTVLYLNAWAIHRDPESWDDPFAFRPERFLGTNIDSKGQNFQLIPFGSGRRICVGMLLGERTAALTLARLVQSFDWKLPDKLTPQTMDMKEKFGIVLRMREPLKIIPVRRNI